MAFSSKQNPGPLRWRLGDPVPDAFRRWGYLTADLDPLRRLDPYVHHDLAEAVAQISDDRIQPLRSTYCGTLAVEFMHMIEYPRVEWVAGWIEQDVAEVDRERIFEQLLGAELFERFLHRRYVATKRFSLEGLAALVPLLEAVLDEFAGSGGESVVMAISHRGRLNVMANILDVPRADVFAGLEDIDPRSVLGSGDVKYHLGATGNHRTGSGGEVEIHLVSNPSHLEAVDPVAMGRARAKQDRRGDGAQAVVLPISMHGDAAFAGQGITAETLNLAKLQDYQVGGTIHIILNNLIGFTAEFPLLHSSRFSSDLGKRLSIPIVHVNGEDPEAVVRAGRLAAAYRARFGDDVIVDLIGYRRYGHSEVEDPSTTQPLLYAKIAQRRMLWESYGKRIGRSREELARREAEIMATLGREQDEGRARTGRPLMRRLPGYWNEYSGGRLQPEFYDVETGVARERLREIAARLTAVPEGFHLHPKIQRLFQRRAEMGEGKRAVDWGMAEALALGSLLREGTSVRFAGEDSRRGTFNHRHATVVDIENGREYQSLSHLAEGQGRVSFVDTPLSEAAALGYEYGYSRDYPDALVCWEAQFGDFANGAQTIIDQFVCAGESKWRLLSGLVMLLPHGHEGQGPEHSSARLERFLQLAANDNIQICQPSTSGQYFHLLRRQALSRWRKPLVVLTPKSLLRADSASSSIDAFVAGGRFAPVLADVEAERAERVLLCSGKIAHELSGERRRRGDRVTAIIRLEQLYPFPRAELERVLSGHASARKIIWVQEEPANTGALRHVRPSIERLLGDRHLSTVKRSEGASPATGSAKAHGLEQAALLRLAFA